MVNLFQKLAILTNWTACSNAHFHAVSRDFDEQKNRGLRRMLEFASDLKTTFESWPVSRSNVMEHDLTERATTNQDYRAERRDSLEIFTASSGEGTLTSSETSTSSHDVPAPLASLPGGSSTVNTNLPELDYNEYCNVIAHQSDYMIFRRFSRLNARILLFMQKQLVDLENKLILLDGEHFYNLRWNPSRQDNEYEREALIREIETKLLQYHSLASKTAESSARPWALENHIHLLKDLPVGTRPLCAGSQAPNPTSHVFRLVQPHPLLASLWTTNITLGCGGWTRKTRHVLG